MRRPVLLAALALPVLLVGAPVPKLKPRDETVILGTWWAESMDIGEGHLLPSDMTWVLEGDGVLRTPTGSDRTEGKWQYKIDPTAEVKTIDFTVTEPGGKGQAKNLLGVYELDGDTLKVHLQTAPGEGRPRDLKAATAWAPLITFKRVKGEKEEPKKDR